MNNCGEPTLCLAAWTDFFAFGSPPYAGRLCLLCLWPPSAGRQSSEGPEATELLDASFADAEFSCRVGLPGSGRAIFASAQWETQPGIVPCTRSLLPWLEGLSFVDHQDAAWPSRSVCCSLQCCKGQCSQVQQCPAQLIAEELCGCQLSTATVSSADVLSRQE